MTEREHDRLIAWSRELIAVHDRLRSALRLAQDAALTGQATPTPPRDLLLFCHGFCAALDGHHRGEDRRLFPALEASHPELSATLRALERDHSMIAHLLGGLRTAVEAGESPAQLTLHLDGVAAIMESHFRYEERQLLGVLEALELDADRHETLGPL